MTKNAHPAGACSRAGLRLLLPFVLLFTHFSAHAQPASLAPASVDPPREIDLSRATLHEAPRAVLEPTRFAESLSALDQLIFAADLNLITGTETHPKVTQDGGYTWVHGNTVVVVYVDSRESTTNYSGVSVSTNGGQTFTRLIPSPFTGLGSNFGTPTVFYSVRAGKWFVTALASGCGGQGLGQWESTNGINWIASGCVASGNSIDNFGTWVDNNPASPFYGRQYVAFNNFAIGNGSPQFSHSVDDGVAWSAPATLFDSFRRITSVTGSRGTDGTVFVHVLDEGGGGLNGPRRGYVYRSVNGGAPFTEHTQHAATYLGPGRGVSGYFATIYNTPSAYWREMGWGQTAVGPGGVVHHVYSARPAGGDIGNIYYIRSTNNGTTWSAPVQLNTDATLRAQWSPSISVNSRGFAFISWYDERNTTNVDRTTHLPTLQRFGRSSRDNGLNWTPEVVISNVTFPIPLQPDPGVNSVWVGNWDVAAFSDNGFGSIAYHTWTDGRVFISSAPQQDVFIKKIAFAPVLLTARSRLTHGAAGTFDIDLPLTGPRGIEPRLGGGTGAGRTYTIVLGFDQPVVSGGVTMSGVGSFGGATFQDAEMIVQLNGVTDGQTITLTAQNVSTPDGATLSSASVPIGFLSGDVNGTASVNATDVATVKSFSGATVNAANFRNDIIVSGGINATDVAYVKSRSGTSLP
jgi:hypothetical protein